MFDSLKAAKRLENVGVSREQSEAYIELMAEIMNTNFATKEDVKEVKQDIKDLLSELKQLEYRLTIRTGAIICVGLTALVALSRLGFLGGHL